MSETWKCERKEIKRYSPQTGELVATDVSYQITSSTGEYVTSLYEYKGVTPNAEKYARMVAALPEMLNALKGYAALVDENILVRNTGLDADMMEFVRQGARLVAHLQAADTALAKAEGRAL